VLPQYHEVVVIGGAAHDITGKCLTNLVQGCSTSGQVAQTCGGVARNIAEALQRLGLNPLLISVVGDDDAGGSILRRAEQIGISTRGIQKINGCRTGIYFSLLDEKGDLVNAIVDMAIFTEKITPEYVNRFLPEISSSKMVVMDGNLSLETMDFLCKKCKEFGIPLWFDPTSIRNSIKIVQANLLSYVTFISPNFGELKAISSAIQNHHHNHIHNYNHNHIYNHLHFEEDYFNGKLALLERHQLYRREIQQLLQGGVQNVVLKVGSDGIAIACLKGNLVGQTLPTFTRNHIQKEITNTSSTSIQEIMQYRHFEAFPAKVISVDGAGDSLVAGLIGGIVSGRTLTESAPIGLMCAKFAIEAFARVSPRLNPALITEDFSS